MRWLVGDSGSNSNDMISVTLVLEGAVSRQYDFGEEEGCGEPGSAGLLEDGRESSFSCSMGDCGLGVSVERKRQRVLIKESSGCQVGDHVSGQDRTIDDFTLPDYATVTVKVEKEAL